MSQLGDQTRGRLLEAAGEIFAQKGFQAATVREICSRAGANPAAVNYHFGDKQRLYAEVVRHAHSGGAQQPPPEWPPGTDPAVKLRDFIRQMLSHLLDTEQPAWHAQLMIREMFTPTEACAALVEADIRPRADLLNHIIGELVSEQTPASDRHLIAFSIIGQCLFFNSRNRIAPLLVGQQEYDTYDIARLADHIAQFSLAGLGHAEPVGPRSRKVAR